MILKIKNEVRCRYERDILGKRRLKIFDRNQQRRVNVIFLKNADSEQNLLYKSNKNYMKIAQHNNLVVIEPLHLKKVSDMRHKYIIILNKYIAIFISALTYYNWLCQKEGCED